MNAVKDQPPRLSRQHVRDRDWVSEHIQELIEKYPNQWIAVYKGEVHAHHENLGPVYDRAKELGLVQPFMSFIERDIYVYRN
jgi:hypothetical protein